MAELKPCPFCGGEARIMGDEDYFWGECLELECVAQTRGSKSREKAIAQWNRRADDKDLFDAVSNIDWSAKK